MKKILFIFGGIFTLSVIYFFMQKDTDLQESFVQEVVVQKTVESPNEEVHTFSTKVKNIDEAIVSAQVAGTIKNITLNEGDAVKKGQVIGYIDATEYAAQYRQAESGVRIAQEQEKLARRKWEDLKPEEREQIKFETEKSRAILSESAAYLAKSQIIAPFDGIISTKFVSDGSSITQGDAVVRVIGDASKKEVTFDVLHEVAVSFSLGDVVHVMSGDHSSEAVIYAIDPVSDEQTRKVRIHAQISDPDVFSVGEFVDVYIAIDADRSDSEVPMDALVRFYDDHVVFVVEEGRANMVKVDVVEVIDENASITNIYPGEMIVVRSAHLLQDGDAVKIVNEK